MGNSRVPPDGSVIVTRISDGKVTYLSRGRREEAELGRLTEAMSGNVLVAYPSADACELDYASHHFTEVADRAKKWVLIAACAALFAYLFISNRLYSHVSTVLLIFPQYINLLALCNLICLPFSFWSVWYQNFRAHAWCTLCLCVQSMLWLLFFCYLFGGWLHGLLPLLDRQNVSQQRYGYKANRLFARLATTGPAAGPLELNAIRFSGR